MLEKTQTQGVEEKRITGTSRHLEEPEARCRLCPARQARRRAAARAETAGRPERAFAPGTGRRRTAAAGKTLRERGAAAEPRTHAAGGGAHPAEARAEVLMRGPPLHCNPPPPTHPAPAHSPRPRPSTPPRPARIRTPPPPHHHHRRRRRTAIFDIQHGTAAAAASLSVCRSCACVATRARVHRNHANMASA